MLNKKVVLNKENGFSVDMNLNPEMPYFEIEYLKAINCESYISFELYYKYYVNGKYNHGPTDRHSLDFDERRNSMRLNNEKNLRGYDKLELKLNFSEGSEGLSDNFMLEVHYRTINLLVDVEAPSESFKRHIEDKTNAKILFSGEFGQGKTTFLNHFFEKEEKEYSVIKVFPVNYSVSSNEDIFRYIKCDILFQLLGMDLEFEKNEVSISESLSTFLEKNVHKAIGAFISMIPKVGKDLYEIIKRFEDLKEKYLEFHDNLQMDDFESAKIYIEEIYNKEGGLFEDNFYTQLIRELLAQIEGQGKKTVLVLEDLDRIDPDHIFRILNVISVHYDNQYNENGSYNKFGFSKIIVVCDLNNIRSIYHYRYGPEVNFEGYVNKFYSRVPFFYNNDDAVIKAMEDIEILFYNSPSSMKLPDYFHKIIHLILRDLIKTRQLSLREILKLKSQNIESFFGQRIHSSAGWVQQKSTVIYPIINYFSSMGGAKSFQQKIQACLNSVGNYHYDEDELQSYITLMLAMYDSSLKMDETKAYEFSIRKDKMTGLYYAGNIVERYLQVGGSNSNVSFTIVDFYNILLKNIGTYIRMKNS